jgi:hypothetical protein
MPQEIEHKSTARERSISSLTGNASAGYAVGHKARMVCDRWPTQHAASPQRPSSAIRGDGVDFQITSPAVVQPRSNPLYRRGRPLRCDSPAFRDGPPLGASSGTPRWCNRAQSPDPCRPRLREPGRLPLAAACGRWECDHCRSTSCRVPRKQWAATC